ncbi:TraB/GumN family protein [Aestuariibacter sp. A3R04]|uniref:TraB/GumN family protein n=1 Tax=Aestuariibacter sp. A3R04 TaxID=2841571 RepID=UPI001C081C86|nr:TraB/GumN family protein [Aestuariibacter sp. A3R04]MBU3023340.1 TraB/GumN family protein [Aestuariibacter sp. A3R04]
MLTQLLRIFTSRVPAAGMLFCLISFNGFAASVWEVSKNGNTVFLGGTLHILSPSDYPLPSPYNKAYENADTIVFETDLGALNSPEFTRRMMALMMYSDGRTIKDDLSAETYKQLSEFLASRGLSIQQVSAMKPSMLGITLSMLEMQRQGLTSQGVDNFFFTQAGNDGKGIDWFETPEQQLTILANLGSGEEDAYIRYTLDELKTMPDLLSPLKKYWRTGDMTGLYDFSMAEFKADYPDVYNDVLTNRNKAWLPKIEAFLATPETEFVLVGTMHMAGEEGVLAMLKAKGYSVSVFH